MLNHGGKLLSFARQYQIPVAQWLDLSTGVSPFSYPGSPIPAEAWNRLPELDDGLEAAAADYYGCNNLLAVAGSQAAIMALPEVVAQQRGRLGIVALPSVGYKEHQHAWQYYRDTDNRQWAVECYEGTPSTSLLARADVVVVINPNNPTGKQIPLEVLNQWQETLQHRQGGLKGGVLIVDEAFADCHPEQSLLSQQVLPANVIVLRSVGKFFGLAGARVGFVFASPPLLDAMASLLGPWTIPGPSRFITTEALQDRCWQTSMREQLIADGIRLKALLEQSFCCNTTGTALFQTVLLDDAPRIHHWLCQQAILTRLCDEQNALRFGIPASESGWQRLEQVLSTATLPEMVDVQGFINALD
ncbi:threonine-phosphate decarboxylase CobD [Photobacterium nomapromontoriensis]|uniref:threonine-phosphate decarboxylase CobD n=1 Tax=Photobacterium nomapromontoriensis TaxID=2910237 RepID=UPI003D0E2EA2